MATKKQIDRALKLLKKSGATDESIDKLLECPTSIGIFLDLFNPSANLLGLCRHQIRAMIELPRLIHIEQRLSFGALAHLEINNIADTLSEDILKDLNKSHSPGTYEFEEVLFGDSISTKRVVEKFLGIGDGWKPFNLEHLVYYLKDHRTKVITHPIVAAGQTLTIKEKQYLFVAGSEKKNICLYLVPAYGHKWSDKTIFPKYRPVIG